MTSAISVLVLAAGFGSRFGHKDKLGAPLMGRPVAHHILSTLETFSWSQKLLVCRHPAGWTQAYERAGFSICLNPQPQKGMLSSLRAGVPQAGADQRIMVCLADMPFVSSAHLSALIAASDREQTRIMASQAGDYRGPPAIFPPGVLLELPPEGEGGARSLLADARLVPVEPDQLRDIDTQDDLAALDLPQALD